MYLHNIIAVTDDIHVKSSSIAIIIIILIITIIITITTIITNIDVDATNTTIRFIISHYNGFKICIYITLLQLQMI